jgi:membrane-bound ClpP family serine protease
MTYLIDVVTQSAVLTSVIIVVAIALFVIETFSPHSFGMVGLLGALVVAGLFYAYQAAGIGHWFGPMLMIIGVGFVLTETMGIHFHGVLIMIGAAAIGAGFFFALGAGANAGIASTAGIIASFCALFYTFKVLPLSSFWLKSGAGHVLQLQPSALIDNIVVGNICVASSDLRPCGIVMIGEHRIPARSVDGFVRTGTSVTISEVRKHDVLVSVDRM